MSQMLSDKLDGTEADLSASIAAREKELKACITASERTLSEEVTAIEHRADALDKELRSELFAVTAEAEEKQQTIDGALASLGKAQVTSVEPASLSRVSESLPFAQDVLESKVEHDLRDVVSSIMASVAASAAAIRAELQGSHDALQDTLRETAKHVDEQVRLSATTVALLLVCQGRAAAVIVLSGEP